MSRQSTLNITGSQVNILENAEHFVSVNLKVSKSVLTLTDGILKAGTIIDKTGKSVNSSSLGATAFGIVLNDIDFKNVGETEVIPVVIHGFIRTSALPAQPVAEAKTALNMIMFL